MTNKEFELNKNQIVMLEFLEKALSSKEHPVNLNAAFGFKTYHNESEDQIQRYVDYLAISNHGNGLGYVAENSKGAWITESGKKALAHAKAISKIKK